MRNLRMNDQHYGYVINTYWNSVNMLTKMQKQNPQRFKEFNYSQENIYNLIDKLQHEQHSHD